MVVSNTSRGQGDGTVANAGFTMSILYIRILSPSPRFSTFISFYLRGLRCLSNEIPAIHVVWMESQAPGRGLTQPWLLQLFK